MALLYKTGTTFHAVGVILTEFWMKVKMDSSVWV